MNGGLGNQLFGAAFAHSLSDEHGLPVQLSTFYLTDRPLALDQLLLSKNLEISNIAPPLHGAPRKLRPHAIFDKFTRTYTEKSFHFLPEAISLKARKFYFGYFQSPKYFYKHEKTLKRMFELKTKSPKLSRLISETQGDSTIGIHFRRGDYIGKEKYHGLANEQYFRNAIDLLSKDLNRIKIVVFSEDRISAKKIFPEAAKIITPQDLESSAETLVLMSNVPNFIGSNSSFSWWSAYLATQKSRPSIFPRPWFSTPNNNDRDLLMPGWITLGNGFDD